MSEERPPLSNPDPRYGSLPNISMSDIEAGVITQDLERRRALIEVYAHEAAARQARTSAIITLGKWTLGTFAGAGGVYLLWAFFHRTQGARAARPRPLPERRRPRPRPVERVEPEEVEVADESD